MREKMVAKLICCFLLSLGCAALFAENLKVKQIVEPKYYDTLVKEGLYSEYRDDGDTIYKLLPKSVYSKQIQDGAVEKAPKGFAFTYEGLYLLNKKELLKKSNSSASTITIDDVTRVARTVSKMEGMMYYSTTHKKDRVLYKKCFMIAGPGDKTKIADENTGNADGQVSYCLQDDASFGVNTYKLNYFQKNDEMFCRFELLDELGIGPFHAIMPGKMITNMVAIDCGDDLLLYLCTDLDAKKLPGIRKQVTDSMTSRMDAVYKWFLTQF
jgi:hypothetical protein